MKLKYLIINTDEIAGKLADNWDHDQGSLFFFRASSNYIYKFKKDEKDHYLRFAINDERSMKQIESEIEFIGYLYAQGYPVSCPLKSKKGELIETVEHDGYVYYGSVFPGMAGMYPDYSKINDVYFENLGKSLAGLHNLSENFKPLNQRDDWKIWLDRSKTALSESVNEVTAVTKLEKLVETFETLQVTENNFGLIHYDFEYDNLFFDKDSATFSVIDFDDCHYHWYVMDIVNAVNDIRDATGERCDKALDLFLSGYKSLRNIDGHIYNNSFLFERYSNLIKYARIKRSIHDSNFEKDPDWLEELRPKLEFMCEELLLDISLPWKEME